MIYTITLNPSIDYIMFTDNFAEGQLNRASETYQFAGGKGINVSRVLKEHGIENTALGFTGGYTGAFIKETLAASGIHHQFVEVDGDTRINVKLKGGSETEINAPGPSITEENTEQLLELIRKMSKEDTVVIAGSIPGSMNKDIYESIAKICFEQGITFVVDAEKELMNQVLEFKPLFVKPNKSELEEMFDIELLSDSEITDAARRLMDKGAQNVFVSLGGDGAILVTKDKVLKAVVPNGKVVNTVGSGDSTVAGMISGIVEGMDIESSFKRAVASGTATAFTEDLAVKSQIDEVIGQIEIKNISVL